LPVPLYSCFDPLVLRFFAVLLLLTWSHAALLCLKLAQVWVACCIVTGAEEKKKGTKQTSSRVWSSGTGN
jgi:hypothetical protein